ncbi:hypothetical protein [Chryseobacterium populi]|uniref:Uncharacterized protein n=1 Tax=Chryseobacterium populi TaxID=1144316 RepID=J2KMT3_9FLAO|nr:hypothetical protein [Chryseobacterium populi]EJL74403.1 hypothetical protein PMI13_01142 [Chryseobacterium populi]
MKYVTIQHTGDHTIAPRIKAKKTASAVKRICAVDAKSQRYSRDQKRQAKVRTDCNVTNGFIKASFLPKLKSPKNWKVGKNHVKTERDFYKSLSQLSEYYGIEVMQVTQFKYPYNIALSLSDAQIKLQSKISEFEEIRVLQVEDKTFLTTEERYNTRGILYYIPVVPLYRMLKNRERKRSAQLLLSVCSYLYHIASIPYYRQEHSFLHWQYEMLKDWIIEDDYSEETSNLREFEKANWIGAYMEQKIYNAKNLDLFKQRLTRFKANDLFDTACLQVAEKAFALCKQYPNQSIFRNANLREAEEEEREETVGMETYISFWADGKGWLSTQLEESVNNHLQEYSTMEEPTIIKRFDQTPIPEGSLDFEKKLFALIEELAEILNYH